MRKPLRPSLSLIMAALGVVYGDIGTSPLYAANGIFGGGREGLPPTPDNARGFASLVVWTITLVVSLKYLVFVLGVDDEGEGGTFALYGLIHKRRGKELAALLWLLVLAAGLLFGEGVITPAISILSAVEGLSVVTPKFAGAVVPLTIVILTGLFAVQSYGTAKVGRVFGPIIALWFFTIAILGLGAVLREPTILAAVDPRFAVRFLLSGGLRAGAVVLGAAILAVTGTEALFADMGHFGRGPIRVGWFSLVYPSLILNYLGQGALLSSGARITGGSVFFSMVPAGALVPVVILATAATIIASQALVSGAFSLSAQAVALGLLPRLRIVHTHQGHAGQIYVPLVNGLLYAGCATLVLFFRSSGALAAAYGLAVSGVMLATSLAMTAVARRIWGWTSWRSNAVFGSFAILDAAFVVANSAKFFEGGVIPLAIGIAIFIVMATWKWGRKATFEAYTRKHTMTMGEVAVLKESSDRFLERNAFLMVPKPPRSLHGNSPALLQLLWDRYGVLPRHLIFVEVAHRKSPYVEDDRYHVVTLQRSPGKGCIVSVTVTFGFMEEPNVERVLEEIARHREIGVPLDPKQWTVHVSVENILPPRRAGVLRRIRVRLFAVLRQISQPAYYSYGLGHDVQLSAEILPVQLG